MHHAVPESFVQDMFPKKYAAWHHVKATHLSVKARESS